MKTSLFKTVLASAFVVLVAPGLAQAHEKCSNSDLRGVFAFHASGFNIVGGVPQPKAIVELIDFNGDGTLTVPAATVSINGIISRSPPGGTGTYSVNHDCTGELAFGAAGPHFDLFIGSRTSVLYLIQTGPGTPVFEGTAERISR